MSRFIGARRESASGCGCTSAGLPFHTQAALAGQRLRERADALRIEVLGAGVEAAQVALAAVQRAGDHRRVRAVEAERPHRGVRLDRVAEQVARAQVGAEAALVARRPPDALHLAAALAVPRDQRMRRRAARSRRRASSSPVRRGSRRAVPSSRRRAGPRRRPRSPRRPPRSGRRSRMPTGTRSVTGVRTAPATVRYLCVTGRSRPMLTSVSTFTTTRADVFRQAAGRDDAADRVVDQQELVAGRVGVLAAAGCGRPSASCGASASCTAVYLFLIPTMPCSGAHERHDRREAAQHRRRPGGASAPCPCGAAVRTRRR